jgi:hypothetical protein
MTMKFMLQGCGPLWGRVRLLESEEVSASCKGLKRVDASIHLDTMTSEKPLVGSNSAHGSPLYTVPAQVSILIGFV